MISARFFEEVFVTQIYKPVRDLGDLNTVIDLGACTGEFSLWVYQQAQKIYAVEADLEAYKNMEENVKDFSKIKPVYLAIGGGIGGGASIIHGLSENRPEVIFKTLATFMKDEKIEQVDVLKTDVESAEKEIFEAPDFGEIADKVKYILGEHLGLATGRLEALGFEVSNFAHGVIAKRKELEWPK